MTDTDFAQFLDLMGDGAQTVVAEFNALCQQLSPEQGQVVERFFDMLATGVKMGFEHREALDAAFVEALDVSYVAALLLHGVDREEVKRILTRAHDDAMAAVGEAS